MGSLTVPLMSAEEARSVVTRIKTNLHTTRALLLDLHRREGWRALGYKSWRDCILKEFSDTSQTHLYRELAAAEVELNISPTGEVGWMPETHARELTGLSPELQALVYEQAQEVGPVTASGLADLVKMVASGLPPEKLASAIRYQEEAAKADSVEDKREEWLGTRALVLKMLQKVKKLTACRGAEATTALSLLDQFREAIEALA